MVVVVRGGEGVRWLRMRVGGGRRVAVDGNWFNDV